MANLIVCLGTGKGTWTEVFKLVSQGPWEKIFIVTNEFGRDNAKIKDRRVEYILINPEEEMESMGWAIKEKLTGRVTGWEAGLNFVSGTGKEHMAVLLAVMTLGLPFRLVNIKNDMVNIL